MFWLSRKCPISETSYVNIVSAHTLKQSAFKRHFRIPPALNRTIDGESCRPYPCSLLTVQSSGNLWIRHIPDLTCKAIIEPSTSWLIVISGRNID
ncbi:hypothetical protein J6590_041798 [Homalodisca vitripennis]|nr:hypothetical protein J6590_041798 [Homalodisca vitripennis]